MKTGLFVFGVLLLLAGIALVLVSIVVVIIALVRRGKARPSAAVVSPSAATMPTAAPEPAQPGTSHAGVASAPVDATVVLPLRGDAGAGVLRCLKGPREGSAYPIPAEGFWIGRDPSSAQVIVDNGAVSKRHVWIGPRDGTVVASDPGSTNGTYLQSDPAKRIGEVVLRSGDVVVIADDLARFEYQR